MVNEYAYIKLESFILLWRVFGIDPKILPQIRVDLRGRNLSPRFAGSYSYKYQIPVEQRPNNAFGLGV